MGVEWKKAVVLLFLLVPGPAWAQRIPVEVEHTGVDRVGQAVAYSLKEFIRGSHGMTLAADNPIPKIRVILVSTESHAQTPGVSSAVAVSFLYDAPSIPLEGALITLAVHNCGRDRVDSCARSILVTIDRQIEVFRKDRPGFWKALSTGTQ